MSLNVPLQNPCLPDLPLPERSIAVSPCISALLTYMDERSYSLSDATRIFAQRGFGLDLADHQRNVTEVVYAYYFSMNCRKCRDSNGLLLIIDPLRNLILTRRFHWDYSSDSGSSDPGLTGLHFTILYQADRKTV